MASPTQWTWVWVDSGSWWWTGRPGVLLFMGSQRVGHDWVTELNWALTCDTTESPFKCLWELFSLPELDSFHKKTEYGILRSVAIHNDYPESVFWTSSLEKLFYKICHPGYINSHMSWSVRRRVQQTWRDCHLILFLDKTESGSLNTWIKDHSWLIYYVSATVLSIYIEYLINKHKPYKGPIK